MLTLSEIPKLQIYRHEKQNFVEVMQGYVSVLMLKSCSASGDCFKLHHCRCRGAYLAQHQAIALAIAGVEKLILLSSITGDCFKLHHCRCRGAYLAQHQVIVSNSTTAGVEEILLQVIVSSTTAGVEELILLSIR